MVEEHWFLTSRAIEPGEVAEAMVKSWVTTPVRRRYRRWIWLANKRLVEKLTGSDHKRGKVVSFQPLKSRRCA